MQTRAYNDLRKPLLTLHGSVHRMRTVHNVYCSYFGLRSLTLSNRGPLHAFRGRTVFISVEGLDFWTRTIKNDPPAMLSWSYAEVLLGPHGRKLVDL